jgi:CHAT domain-containing protein
VASFQKALHAAGAQFVLTSLWKVDDSATRELMLEFYAGLWSERLAPPQALARAKSKLRERRAPPRDWAGWTLSSL